MVVYRLTIPELPQFHASVLIAQNTSFFGYSTGDSNNPRITTPQVFFSADNTRFCRLFYRLTIPGITTLPPKHTPFYRLFHLLRYGNNSRTTNMRGPPGGINNGLRPKSRASFNGHYITLDCVSRVWHPKCVIHLHAFALLLAFARRSLPYRIAARELGVPFKFHPMGKRSSPLSTRISTSFLSSDLMGGASR